MRHALYIDLGPKIGSSFSQGERSNRENKAFHPLSRISGSSEGDERKRGKTRKKIILFPRSGISTQIYYTRMINRETEEEEDATRILIKFFISLSLVAFGPFSTSFLNSFQSLKLFNYRPSSSICLEFLLKVSIFVASVAVRQRRRNFFTFNDK